MPKKSAIDKIIEDGKVDTEAVDLIRGVATQLGRAIYHTAMLAATHPYSTRDEEREEVDGMWSALADKIILIATED